MGQKTVANRIRKYQRPDFLIEFVTQKDYEKWLYRKTKAHIKRDRGRVKNFSSSPEEYRTAIYKAVCESGGLDAYTGEELRWDKIGRYNNIAAKAGGREYKAGFADLPTVDHVGHPKGPPKFEICSWKVNDAKSDLPMNEFIDLCESVLKYSRRNHGCSGLK